MRSIIHLQRVVIRSLSRNGAIKSFSPKPKPFQPFHTQFARYSTESQQDNHANEPVDPKRELDSLKTQILHRAVQDTISKYGFTEDALLAAADAQDIPREQVAVLFSRGPVELVEHFVKRCNQRLENELSTAEFASLKGITAKVRTACQIRLKMLEPVLPHWRQAMALMSLPQNLSYSIPLLAQLSDSIWFMCGDRTSLTDPNHHSKRAMLGAVYASTELFLSSQHDQVLAESTDPYDQTFKFLDRRLEDVATFGKLTGEAARLVDFVTKSAAGILESRGIKLR